MNFLFDFTQNVGYLHIQFMNKSDATLVQLVFIHTEYD